MQTEMAIVVSAEWPACVVRRLGSDERVEALVSEAMQQNYIRLSSGDLVRVDFTANPAEVVYRLGFRATVTEIRGDRVTLGSLPNGREDAVGVVPPQLGLSISVGDAVFLKDVHAPVVVDVLAGDEPAHPEWFVRSAQWRLVVDPLTTSRA